MWRIRFTAPLAAWALSLALLGAPARAQHQHHPPPEPPAAEPAQPPEEPAAHDHGAMDHDAVDNQSMDHEAMGHDSGSGAHSMRGFFGPYSMSREASGTAWQPESSPHSMGLHTTRGPWELMTHGFVTLVWDDQDGPRGDEDLFSGSMIMGMASRPLGERGRFGLRAMISAEPWTIGDEGYPLLLQTGETADGVHPLVDRQHPHDLFMELAATYSHALDGDSSVFLYLGLPGEPALGPPAFMHRFSGLENPAAPLSHHWLDSTHITFGVATLGWVSGGLKLEGSVFTGREPDEKRENIESPKMDSYSLRATYQPAPDWSFQASFGRLHSPEQLEPEIDTDRTTVSAIYNRPLPGGNWQTTLAWGRNSRDPGETTDALLLESAVSFEPHHTVFTRLERIENDELFGHGDGGGHHHEEDAAGPEAGSVFDVREISLGYLYDAVVRDPWKLGVGVAGTVLLLPSGLDEVYGETPVSWMAFLRVRL